MKKINKFLSMFLALMMLISIIPMSSITASAQTVPTLTMVTDKTTVEVGDVVTIDVYLSENSHISVLTVDMMYDTSAFETIYMETTDIFSSTTNYEVGCARFSGAVVDEVTEGGRIFTVELKALKKSESVIYLNVTECYDVNFNSMYVETNSVSIEALSLVSIQEPSRKSIRYGDGIILYAFIEYDAPAGSFVRWTSNNDNFDREQSGNDLTIISENNGYTTFTATLYSAYGEELASESVEMRSKAGFFDKIGGFFRSLFGTTKIYDN